MLTTGTLKKWLGNRPLKKAAVLVLTYPQNGEEHLVLTRRTEEVEHHKGQIAFPGGAEDPNDQSLWETALRETHEEVGIIPRLITQVATLQTRLTPSGFEVTPFVGTIASPIAWQHNPAEIAEVFTIPASFLQNPDNLSWRSRKLHDFQYLDPLFRYHHYEIWGLTARILCEFLGHPFPKEAL